MWEELEFDPERIPLFKLGLHLAQILFAFILWCLEITVFRTTDAAIVGDNGWTFAVCFLSIPAWIYLIMTPRFPRTRKLAQPHAMVAVDALFVVLWLSAFATQAAYNSANLCGSACGISKGVVALGFFVFVFFCLTTFLSVYTLKYYQWNNRLPGYDRIQAQKQNNIDPDKAAFSMAPVDEEAYAPVNQDHHEQQPLDDPYAVPQHHDDQDQYASGAYAGGQAGGSEDPYGSQVSYGGVPPENPFRQHDNPFESDADYHTQAGGSQVGGGGGAYVAPTAQDEYESSGPAQFPTGNYDRITR